jgi:hypothetical protein
LSGSDPASALDFWVGTWDAAWEGGHGTNTVTRDYGGHAIIERFESFEPEPFRGISLSVFDADAACWRQSWVDSQGSHWQFTGGPSEEGFVLTATELKDGVTVRKRMVFFNVRADAFDWRWERSEGDDPAWTPLWAIAYRRRPTD